MKTCTFCGKKKPLTDFYFDRTKQKPRADCKECHKKVMRPRSQEHYLKNKGYYRKRNRAQRARLAEIIRSKKAAPCVDCGRAYPPYVMDFDHARGDKMFNISRGRLHGSNQLEEELKKCDLVCSNCHRIRTHERSARRGHRTPDLSDH